MAVETMVRRLDLRGRTITTAVAWAAHEQLVGLTDGDDLELLVDAFPAILPDLEAWCRTTGNALVDVKEDGETQLVRLRKGPPRRNDHRLAVVCPMTRSTRCSCRWGSPWRPP